MRWALIISLVLVGCDLVSEPLEGGAASPENRDTACAEGSTDLLALDGTTGGAKTGPIGRTVASMGDATKPGLWLKTPLVDARGRNT